VSACKRHGASRPVPQKGWSHFFTPADHQKLRPPHVAPSGLCLFLGIGHGLAHHGYIMPPHFGAEAHNRGLWDDGAGAIPFSSSPHVVCSHKSGTARAVRCRFVSVDNHGIHHGEHRVHGEVRNPGAISNNSLRLVFACKRHGASRPVSQKGWSHFFTPAHHQNLRRLHVARSGRCLFSGIGHGLAGAWLHHAAPFGADVYSRGWKNIWGPSPCGCY
jgi:hypothetical protein